MTAMSRSGCDPNLAMWEDPKTLLHSITFTLTKNQETGEQFKKFTVSQPKLRGKRGVKRLAYASKENSHEASVATPDIDCPDKFISTGIRQCAFYKCESSISSLNRERPLPPGFSELQKCAEACQIKSIDLG